MKKYIYNHWQKFIDQSLAEKKFYMYKSSVVKSSIDRTFKQRSVAISRKTHPTNDSMHLFIYSLISLAFAANFFSSSVFPSSIVSYVILCSSSNMCSRLCDYVYSKQCVRIFCFHSWQYTQEVPCDSMHIMVGRAFADRQKNMRSLLATLHATNQIPYAFKTKSLHT